MLFRSAAQAAAISAAAADATTKANAAQAAAILAAATELGVERTRATDAENALSAALTALDGRTPSSDSFTELKTYLIALHNYYFDNRNNTYPQPNKTF